MKQNKDPEQILREYRVRQNRQLIAMVLAIFAVLLAAVLYKRPGVLGTFSKTSLFSVQAVAIAAFLGFSAFNWRCPNCSAYLGADIHRTRCRSCGSSLQ
jgi:hypothetical protein